MEELSELEKIIDYEFRNQELLRKAMTHSSYANERKINKIECNERLEFLGDAVLEMISSNFLFHQFPKMPEGDLSRIRASLVCETALAECAKNISLGDYIFLGKGEAGGGGREKASVTSDAFEALIGAIFLDGGIAAAEKFILSNVLSDAKEKMEFYDSKSVLQELIQQKKDASPIHYQIIGESGPEHQKQFVVQVLIGETVYGQGTGKNKKTAEKMAALEAIRKLRGKC
ncbi:MAG: ribonuclease III [Lachnospiraceae bacterium]